MARIAVWQLARELGIKPNDVFDLAREAGCPVVRVAATLAPANADKIRARKSAMDTEAAESRREENARTSLPTPCDPARTNLRHSLGSHLPERPWE